MLVRMPTFMFDEKGFMTAHKYIKHTDGMCSMLRSSNIQRQLSRPFAPTKLQLTKLKPHTHTL